MGVTFSSRSGPFLQQSILPLISDCLILRSQKQDLIGPMAGEHGRFLTRFKEVHI